ncbi:MAG: hypothetical protein NTU83_08685 [Candidatus Hydrogenedentes bacterium]|nr:hypothetical protein [Candidatus Hydrogenedentota bacterium]
MACNEVSTRLIGYLNDDLPPRLRRDVAEHLERCYLCAEELNGVSSIIETCRDVLRFPAPRNRFDELRPRLRKPSLFLPRPRHIFRDAMAGLAAACAVIAFGWLLAPVVRTTVDLARLAEHATEPGLAWSLDSKTAKASPRMPMLTLLAWAREVQREDPLSEDVQDRPQPEPNVETPPPPYTNKPISMRQHERRRMLLAEGDLTRT